MPLEIQSHEILSEIIIINNNNKRGFEYIKIENQI